MTSEVAVTENRHLKFDESLLSGYLDGELTQAERQRIEILMADDPLIRRKVDELREMREAALTTPFKVPDDEQWNERPKGALSAISRHLGLGLLLIWFALLVGYGLWEVALSGEKLVAKLLVFAAFSGFGLVFVSVLIDRLRVAGTDRYRRVEK